MVMSTRRGTDRAPSRGWADNCNDTRPTSQDAIITVVLTKDVPPSVLTVAPRYSPYMPCTDVLEPTAMQPPTGHNRQRSHSKNPPPPSPP
ncbi:unnamed protein product [Schistocephalus solidus]|uniref:Uncharacterized protein n=1 Tax=Schistocephalus solidus TaxID=70667 RepID=A0A183T2N2_SCHSO|nr:unnamed protein product [Schistocephalus solidus]